MFLAAGKQIPAVLLEAMGGEKVSDDEELTPGIRPASDILAEIQGAVAVIKGRK